MTCAFCSDDVSTLLTVRVRTKESGSRAWLCSYLVLSFVLTLTNSKQCGNIVRTKGTGHNKITNLITQQTNNDTTNKRITNRKDIITFTAKSVTHLDWLHVGAATHKAKLI